jgi:GNAT superfamily N-acetyltransferase
MSKQASSLFRMTEADVNEGGRVLREAFSADPFFIYAVPDATAQARCYPFFFTSMLRFGCRFGEAWAVTEDEQIRAVAWWFRFPDVDFTPERLEAIGFDEAAVAMGEEAAARLMNANNAVEDVARRVLPGPTLYLASLVVDPPFQGFGYGSLLLNHFLGAAAESTLPASLITYNPTNVDYYVRRGFHLLAEDVDPTSGLRFWIFGHGNLQS